MTLTIYFCKKFAFAVGAVTNRGDTIRITATVASRWVVHSGVNGQVAADRAEVRLELMDQLALLLPHRADRWLLVMDRAMLEGIAGIDVSEANRRPRRPPTTAAAATMTTRR